MTHLFCLLILLLFSLHANAGEFVGFLLSPEASVVTFVKQENSSWSTVEDSSLDFQDRGFNLFFNGQILGTTKIGVNEKCFSKKLSTNDKLCDQLQAYRDTGMTPPTELLKSTTGKPCAQNVKDLGKEVSCASSLQTQKKTYWPHKNINSKFNTESLTKAQQSKKMNFEWGGFGDFKLRPILLSTVSNIDDPQKWARTAIADLSKQDQDKIFKFILSSKGNFKCIPNKKLKVLKLTKDDIKINYMYKSLNSNRYVINLNFNSAMDKIVNCNENSFPISSLIVVDGNEITDILKDPDSNYNDLELLEAADLNKDGVSELYFANYEYNGDGFALYDLKSKTFKKFVRSSH